MSVHGHLDHLLIDTDVSDQCCSPPSAGVIGFVYIYLVHSVLLPRHPPLPWEGTEVTCVSPPLIGEALMVSCLSSFQYLLSAEKGARPIPQLKCIGTKRVGCWLLPLSCAIVLLPNACKCNCFLLFLLNTVYNSISLSEHPISFFSEDFHFPISCLPPPVSEPF